jgi:hypothetical protein
MRKGILFVQSGPTDPSCEDEYNDWYTNTHIPDLLAGPGFRSAQRYKRVDQGGPPAQGPAYLAIYQLEAEDLADPLAARRERSAQGLTGPSSDALEKDPPPVMTIYERLE